MNCRLILLLLPLLRVFLLAHSRVAPRVYLKMEGGDYLELKNGTEFSLPPIFIPPDDNYLVHQALLNYDGRFPPRFGHGPPVVVRVKSKVLTVPIFLEQEFKLFFEMELTQEWEDERLKLNTSKVVNLSPVQAVQLWQPNPMFEGSGKTILSVFRSYETHQLYPNGTIRHVSQLTLSPPCPAINTKNFPFDRRHCNVSFGPSSHSVGSVVYKWANEGKSMDFVDEAREFRSGWAFPSFRLIEHVKVYREGMIMIRISRLKIQLLAVRDAMYYLKTFVLPMGALVVLALVPHYFMQDNPPGRLIFGAVILGMAADLVLNRPRMSRDAKDADPSLECFCFVCLTWIAGCLLRTSWTVGWRAGAVGRDHQD